MEQDESLLQAGRRMRAPARRRNFGKDERGYALTLTLIAMPLIMGVAAFVIDASRIANLHTDLQDAADAMALAGARELDGRDDAIPRAKAAIAAMTGNTAWFGGGGDGMSMGAKNVAMTYNAANGQGQVTVTFMEGIPAQDDLTIGANNCVKKGGNGSASCNVEASWPGNVVQQSNKAAYVRVRATPVNVRTIFPIPGSGRDDVSVAAEAVATYTAAACDITPLYICNPFESQGLDSFNANFRSGNLYAREFVMGDGVAPGNYGFLAVNGNGANVLRDALATNNPGVCYQPYPLTTEPGHNTGPVEQGLGVRFGIYKGPMSNTDPNMRPAVNVRMGQDVGNNKNKPNPSCSKYDPESSIYDAMPFPAGANPVPNTGGSMSSNSWDVKCYWHVSHGPAANNFNNCANAPAAPSAVTSSRPSLPATSTTSVPNPSRYDVYRYEIANNKVGDQSRGGESGSTQLACYKGTALNTFPDTITNDRRTIVAAVINCNEQFAGNGGGRTNIKATAFVRMFLTRPAVDKQVYMEVVDVTGAGGTGTVENYLREEAELVR